MWKKLLIGITLSLILDVLLKFGQTMEERAFTEEAKNRWKTFQQIILLIKSNPKMLNDENN